MKKMALLALLVDKKLQDCLIDPHQLQCQERKCSQFSHFEQLTCLLRVFLESIFPVACCGMNDAETPILVKFIVPHLSVYLLQHDIAQPGGVGWEALAMNMSLGWWRKFDPLILRPRGA